VRSEHEHEHEHEHDHNRDRIPPPRRAMLTPWPRRPGNSLPTTTCLRLLRTWWRSSSTAFSIRTPDRRRRTPWRRASWAASSGLPSIAVVAGRADGSSSTSPKLHLGSGRPPCPISRAGGASACRKCRDTPAFELAPDWICEALSRSTEALDRTEKLPIYARAGGPPRVAREPDDPHPRGCSAPRAGALAPRRHVPRRRAGPRRALSTPSSSSSARSGRASSRP